MPIPFAESKHRWDSGASVPPPAVKTSFRCSQPFALGGEICACRSHTPQIVVCNTHTLPVSVFVFHRSLFAHEQTCAHITPPVCGNHPIFTVCGLGVECRPEPACDLNVTYLYMQLGRVKMSNVVRTALFARGVGLSASQTGRSWGGRSSSVEHFREPLQAPFFDLPSPKHLRSAMLAETGSFKEPFCAPSCLRCCCHTPLRLVRTTFT